MMVGGVIGLWVGGIVGAVTLIIIGLLRQGTEAPIGAIVFVGYLSGFYGFLYGSLLGALIGGVVGLCTHRKRPRDAAEQIVGRERRERVS